LRFGRGFVKCAVVLVVGLPGLRCAMVCWPQEGGWAARVSKVWKIEDENEDDFLKL